MTHPTMIEALAAAHRDDLLRAAARPRGVVVRRAGSRRRERVLAWLDGQLHRPVHRPVVGPQQCAAVTR